MPKYSAIKARKILISLPEDLAARLDLFLFSPLEQKVPYGARSDVIRTLIENYLELVENQTQ